MWMGLSIEILSPGIPTLPTGLLQKMLVEGGQVEWGHNFYTQFLACVVIIFKKYTVNHTKWKGPRGGS